MFKKLSVLFPLVGLCALFQASCQNQSYISGPDRPPRAVIRDGVAITLRDQKLTVIRNGQMVKDYDISSSKFGIGGKVGSHYTPVGVHAVTKKVGDGQPKGMVFKGRRPTGEVVPVRRGPGEDPARWRGGVNECAQVRARGKEAKCTTRPQAQQGRKLYG